MPSLYTRTFRCVSWKYRKYALVNVCDRPFLLKFRKDVSLNIVCVIPVSWKYRQWCLHKHGGGYPISWKCRKDAFIKYVMWVRQTLEILCLSKRVCEGLPLESVQNDALIKIICVRSGLFLKNTDNMPSQMMCKITRRFLPRFNWTLNRLLVKSDLDVVRGFLPGSFTSVAVVAGFCH